MILRLRIPAFGQNHARLDADQLCLKAFMLIA
jgi:hypothetical protein